MITWGGKRHEFLIEEAKTTTEEERGPRSQFLSAENQSSKKSARDRPNRNKRGPHHGEILTFIISSRGPWKKKVDGKFLKSSPKERILSSGNIIGKTRVGGR